MIMAKVTKKVKSHNDLDGVASGILAKLAFGEDVEVAYCSYENINQAIERFLEKKENDQTILYITDISVNKENEKALQKRHLEGKEVRMIDHHITAEYFNQYAWANVTERYEDGRKTSAASLFYEYLVKKNLLKETASLSQFVELVRQYDTWEWESNQNFDAKRLNDLFYIIGIEEFEKRMIARLSESKEHFSLDEFENAVLDMEEEKINRYIRQKQKQMIETFVDPYYLGVVHAEQYHSEAGNVLSKNNPHLDGIVLVNGGGKRLSFRTIHDHVNLSEFAKNYNGGGHPKASGASLTERALKEYVIDLYHRIPRKVDPEKNKYNTKESKFGTIYENHAKENFWIRPLGEKWVTEDEEDRQIKFDTFYEAEAYLKREKKAWLSVDDVFVEKVVKRYYVKEQTLRSQFEKTMTELLTIQ